MASNVKRFLFNNCRNRPYAELYPEGVFFDLRQDNRQANMATDLSTGDECIVATPVENGDIKFDWFSFTHEKIMDAPDEPRVKVRVLFGEWVRSERLPKSEAARTAPYSLLFNVNGHFKRISAIKQK